MLLLVSLPKLPPGWSLRLLTGWWWIYCVLVVVAYRASMTAILANPAPRVTIDTLDQLANSHISCGGWGEHEKEFFLTSLDDAGKKIGQKFEIVLNEEEAITKVAMGEFAYYGNIFFLRHARIMRQVSTNANHSIGRITVANAPGEKSLHIMRDCVINMPISIGLQKNSPLKTQIDQFLYRIIEAGLVKKWLYNVMLPTNTLENIIKESSSTSALMDLRKMYGALVALGIGYFLSSVVLIGEILHWNYIVKRSPYYDKYAIHLYYSRMKNVRNKM
ncbi:hypothetical protein R5R35_011169 [Gryllus longicercus]|uniref:Ionotropic glutamate receptor C-terminal domain-containing protein n=1 Tax=Gryllus longicercus TaxID=2509291 RepID=A0AAN9VJ46_9ORTH